MQQKKETAADKAARIAADKAAKKAAKAKKTEERDLTPEMHQKAGR